MPRAKKRDIISFKVDGALADILDAVPNRSEFIRTAILNALEKNCPLCLGTGILSPEQQKHWSAFIETHSVRQCDRCKAMHLVCNAEAHDAT